MYLYFKIRYKWNLVSQREWVKSLSMDFNLNFHWYLKCFIHGLATLCSVRYGIDICLVGKSYKYSCYLLSVVQCFDYLKLTCTASRCSRGGVYWWLSLELPWISLWFLPKMDWPNKDLPLLPRNFRRIIQICITKLYVQSLLIWILDTVTQTAKFDRECDSDRIDIFE